MALTVDSLSHSNAEYLLAPLMALRVAEQHQKVLLVIDDALLFKFKETQVMDLADQPFSAFNFANELATRTGIFASGQEVTTILIVDQNTQTLQLQKDEDNYISHIESMADHVVDFGNDQRKKGAKPPVLNFKCGQQFLTMRQWLSPLVYGIVSQFQQLMFDIDAAHTQHLGKREMKIQEDPWDNYLYYDSRYIIPIFCHQNSLPIEQQVLAALFLKRAIDDETISQFKDGGSKLLQELVSFVENDFVQTSQLLEEEPAEKEASLLERIKLACEHAPIQIEEVEFLQVEIERALRMFMLHMQVKGRLHEYKQDYFV